MKRMVMFIPVLLVILSGCGNGDDAFMKVVENAKIGGVMECNSLEDSNLVDRCVALVEEEVKDIPDSAVRAFILREVSVCNNAEDIADCKDRYYYLLGTEAGKDTCSLILNADLKAECGVKQNVE